MTELNRKTLWRWLGRFSLANGLVLLLIGIRFLAHYGWPDGPLATTYLLAASFGHYALLAALPLLLAGAVVIVILPRRGLLTAITALAAAILVAWLFLDSLVFDQNRFHITGLTARILALQTWVFGGIYFVIALLLELQLAKFLWSRLTGNKAGSGGLWLGSAAVICLLFAQITHIWADANYYTPVTGLTEYLPGYRGATAKEFLLERGWADLEQSRERQLASRIARGEENRGLNYPLNPLECNTPGQPLNLLIILVDAMRWDMLNADTSPGLSRFANTHATLFEQHYSGGNSSRMGAFSLFYGLPVTYWKTFESMQRSAVMVDQLEAAGYRFGIFSSAPLYRPVTLDRTAFASVKGLRLATEPITDPPHIRDRKITDEWLQWLAGHDHNAPFFGFLFYDAPTIQDSPADYQGQVQPQSEQRHHVEMARYQTAIHYDDSLIQEVLADLGEQNLLDSTVVVISSDHGEEFAAATHAPQGHGSAYSQQQLQIPFLLHWPQRPAGRANYRTSHNDLVPTLMTDMLGCVNPATDYSSGNHLFAGTDWDWLVTGSYYNYAIIQPESVIITFPNGLFEVRDRDYRLVDEPQLDADVLTAVMRENTRFYK
jgi:membrane-anchored protein YejM (alkaline phosphatase superfamily)